MEAARDITETMILRTGHQETDREDLTQEEEDQQGMAMAMATVPIMETLLTVTTASPQITEAMTDLAA